MRTETIDIYGEITKQIIEAMEAGLPVNWTVAPVMGRPLPSNVLFPDNSGATPKSSAYGSSS